MRRYFLNFIHLLTGLIRLLAISNFHLDVLAQSDSKDKSSDPQSSLECIFFGNVGCQFTCDVKCRLYGCSSTAQCTADFDVCDCNELYHVGKAHLSRPYIAQLSFEDSWNFKFVDNKSSRLIRNLIQQDARTTNALLPIVQEPYISGKQLKNKFKRVFPEAKQLDVLQPQKRGNIDDFVDQNWRFNFTSFSTFLENYANSKTKNLDTLAVREEIDLPTDENSVLYMARQLLLFPNDYTRILIFNYLQSTRVSYEKLNSLTDIESYLSPDADNELSPEQIDEIIRAGAFSKLIEIATKMEPDQQ